MKIVETGNTDYNYSSIQMFDYINLIHTVLDYYLDIGVNEDSEDWKAGTQYDKKNAIPKEIDAAVKRAFISQLKKFE